MLSVSVFAYAEPEPLIPKLSLPKGMTLKSIGWIQQAYKEHKNYGSTQLNGFRIKTFLETKGSFRAVGEIEFSHMDRPDTNWLRQLYGAYKVTEKWEIRVGRLLQPGLYPTPIPYLLQTVKYPRDVFHWYGYGVQAKGDLGNGWSLLLEVTGNSDVTFYKEDQFRQAEFSGRLEKWIESLRLNVATTFHVSHEFSMVGADIRYQPTEKLFFRGLVYHADYLGGELTYGGHLLAEYKVLETKWLNGKFHTMIDYRDEETQKLHYNDAILTNGITIETKNDRWSGTIDYETYFSGDEPDKGRWLIQAQFRF
ncbi:hypothetical protein HON59_01825 [bacterium]|nr:hypothetical protein [bacterium]MBT3730142.1 hypothetical protein [bacterium]MBT4894783.1 hypothetical protein [bacterium]